MVRYIFNLNGVLSFVDAADKEGAFIIARIYGYKGKKSDIRIY